MSDGQPDEAKEWEDLEGIEQEIYPSHDPPAPKTPKKDRCKLCGNLQYVEDLAYVEGNPFCKDSPLKDTKSCEQQQCEFIEWNDRRERT